MGKVTTYYKGDMLFESKLGNHSVLIDVPTGPGLGIEVDEAKVVALMKRSRQRRWTVPA